MLLCHNIIDTEQGPSKGKLAWMKALDRYKEQQTCELKESDGKVADTLLRPTAKTKSIRAKHDKRKALYLIAGQSHSVWTPKKPSVKATGFTDVVMEVVRNKQDLLERQQRLRSRVMATQQVLKVQREEFADASKVEGGDESPPLPQKSKMWQKAIKKVIEDNTKAKRRKRSKRSLHFHDVVSQYMASTSSASNHVDQPTAGSTTTHAKAVARHALRLWRSQYMEDSKKFKVLKKKPFASVASLPLHGIVQHDSCKTIPEEKELNRDSIL